MDSLGVSPNSIVLYYFYCNLQTQLFTSECDSSAPQTSLGIISKQQDTFSATNYTLWRSSPLNTLNCKQTGTHRKPGAFLQTGGPTSGHLNVFMLNSYYCYQECRHKFPLLLGATSSLPSKAMSLFQSHLLINVSLSPPC